MIEKNAKNVIFVLYHQATIAQSANGQKNTTMDSVSDWRSTVF